MRRPLVFALPLAVLALALVGIGQVGRARSTAVMPVPTTLADFFLPGSQPGQSGTLEFPSKCDNCHGGYNLPIEPAFNWRGSMMAKPRQR